MERQQDHDGLAPVDPFTGTSFTTTGRSGQSAGACVPPCSAGLAARLRAAGERRPGATPQQAPRRRRGSLAAAGAAAPAAATRGLRSAAAATAASALRLVGRPRAAGRRLRRTAEAEAGPPPPSSRLRSGSGHGSGLGTSYNSPPRRPADHRRAAPATSTPGPRARPAAAALAAPWRVLCRRCGAATESAPSPPSQLLLRRGLCPRHCPPAPGVSPAPTLTRTRSRLQARGAPIILRRPCSVLRPTPLTRQKFRPDAVDARAAADVSRPPPPAERPPRRSHHAGGCP